MLPEVRMARIIDAIGLHRKRKLSCVEAEALLGLSERHFRRLRDAYEAHGAEGIVDRRPWPGVGPTRAGGRDRMGDRGVPDAPFRFHGQALPRGGTGPGDCRTGGPSRAATSGPRASRNGVVSRPRRRSARLIARSGSAGPCRACWYSRMARVTPGCRRVRRSTSWSLWTMRRARSCRPCWSRRRGRPQASSGSRTWSRRMGCSRRSTTNRGSHYFLTPKAGAPVDSG